MFLTENERQAFINCVAAIADSEWNKAFAAIANSDSQTPKEEQAENEAVIAES
jgi:hypothetical protein